MASENIKQILPVIYFSEAGIYNEIERFQNTTLRPILKYQNELICRLIIHHLLASDASFRQQSSVIRKKQITLYLKQNSSFKNLMLGVIIGYFTSEEFKFYQAHSKEINKRISSMALERITNQYEAFLTPSYI